MYVGHESLCAMCISGGFSPGKEFLEFALEVIALLSRCKDAYERPSCGSQFHYGSTRRFSTRSKTWIAPATTVRAGGWIMDEHMACS